MVKYSRDTHERPEGPFETGRFVLRPLSRDHEEAMWEMFSNPEFVKYVPFPLQIDREAARKRFLAQIEEGERFRFHYAVEWKDTGKMAGFAMARPTKEGENLEIGYCVTPKDWGKGIGTEITRFLVDEIAPLMGAEKIDLIAKIRPANRASVRVAEKCGFRLAGEVNDGDGPQLLLAWRG